MGPVMNLALAVIVMAVVLYQGAPAPAFEQQAVLVGSATDQSPGKAAGIQPGDRVVSIDGKPVETWEQYYMEVMPKAKRQISVVVDRAGKPLQFNVVPTSVGKYDLGDLGLLP